MDRRIQIKQWLKEVLENNLRGVNYQAFIFGSQANKKVLARADIDIGIIAGVAVPADRLIHINNDIQDLPMLFKVDIVDFNTVDEPFKTIALSNTEPL